MEIDQLNLNCNGFTVLKKVKATTQNTIYMPSCYGLAKILLFT